MSGTKNCLVVGLGGHARAILTILDELKNRKLFYICGLLDLNDDYDSTEKIFGHKVIGSFFKFKESASPIAKNIFLAIGDNQQRAEIYKIAEELGYQMPNLISSSAYISPEVTMGKGNVLAPHSYLGGGALIGNNNLINTGAVLEHESKIGNNCHLAPGCVVSGRTTIGNSCFLGAGSTILDYLHISSDVTVGAGAVVTKNALNKGVHMGVPAKWRKP